MRTKQMRSRPWMIMMTVVLTAIMYTGMAVALTAVTYTGTAEAQADRGTAVALTAVINTGTAEAQGGGMVDHSVYDALLKKYVDDRGMIDYRTWKASDVGTLDGYLEMIKAVDPAGLKDRNEVFAYWINTYNALTIRGMLHFYPTSSIRDHVSLLGYSIWKDYKIDIQGREYSLDDIEHNILRKMDEPLVHFALVCASIGCPPLMTEAFTAEDVERQMKANTLVFFADPSKFRADPEENTVWLSPIMDWYKDDFGKNQREVLDYIAPYVPDDAARALLKREDVDVDYLHYDWGINEQRTD